MPLRTLLLILALTAGIGYVTTAQQPATPPPPGSPHQALLDRYCVGCHNQSALSGGLALHTADVLDPTQDPETWEKVIRKLRAGAMPPQGMPRPDDAAVEGLLTYLETSLDRAAAAQPDPGRSPPRRLNRTEYANAIRDLLALDLDVAPLLPTDDADLGVDGNAGAPGIPSGPLDPYASASAKIARLAVGDPNTEPVATTYRTRPDLSQDQRIAGLPLGTRGGLVEQHNFPLDGEYTLKAELARNAAGVIRGLEQEHQIEVLVDGERVFLERMGGAEEPQAEIEARLTARVPVKAGPHKVAVTFVQKNRAERDDILQPFPRTTLDPNEAGLPQVESLIVDGPYTATGPGQTPSREKIFSCQPAPTEEVACARAILRRLAREAYRRPITDRDLEPLLDIYQSNRNRGASFEQGIESALRLILANPQFVFRFEPDPEDVAPGSPYRISDLALASRLSFFLWSSIPDEELLVLASQNKLHEDEVLEQQVRRMLADRKSGALVTNFASQWLDLRSLKSTFPDPQEFPDFDGNLRQDLQTETELFLSSIFREDHNILDLLTANYTFMNERVAHHYGVSNVYGNRFRRVKLTDEQRRGLLGQASILAVTSHTTRTSPVDRGKWILTNLLGIPPPPPPADVPALKENDEGGNPASVRKRMELHRANPSCAGCHKLMDPLGFALENFDATGRRRNLDAGAPIDASGVLLDGTPVDSPKALREALLKRPNVFVGTFTEKLLTYALGRGLDDKDMPTVRAIVRSAEQNDDRFSSIVLGIVKSVPFEMKVKVAQEGSVE